MLWRFPTRIKSWSMWRPQCTFYFHEMFLSITLNTYQSVDQAILTRTYIFGHLRLGIKSLSSFWILPSENYGTISLILYSFVPANLICVSEAWFDGLWYFLWQCFRMRFVGNHAEIVSPMVLGFFHNFYRFVLINFSGEFELIYLKLD